MTQISPQRGGKIDLRPWGELIDWLDAADGSLLATTYNSGKLVALSVNRGVLESRVWKFVRPLGLALHEGQLAIAVRGEIWRFREADDARLLLDASTRRARYALVRRHQTGRLDVHDMAFGRRGLYFVNTRFNCIARPSERVSFMRCWQPSFVDPGQTKDCCHLNGLGLLEGELALATAFCAGNEPGDWRAIDRFTSGVLIDICANRVVATGLSMPHSPRFYDQKWWLCNSGHGTLCRWNGARDACETVAELPGFTRGLSFAAGRALVGLSKLRDKHILDAPPFRERCPQAQAGVALVDPTSGCCAGGVEFVRGGNEVYEVAFLPRVRQLELDLEGEPAPQARAERSSPPS